jgi:hypothetical protein
MTAASTKDESKPGKWGRPRLIFQPLCRTGENPPYGILGETMETSASFEARSAPSSYPTTGRQSSMKEKKGVANRLASSLAEAAARRPSKRR